MKKRYLWYLLIPAVMMVVWACLYAPPRPRVGVFGTENNSYFGAVQATSHLPRKRRAAIGAGTCAAVVEAKVLRRAWATALDREYDQPHYLWLMRVRRVHVGSVEELGPTRLLWVETCTSTPPQWQRGETYVLCLDKCDNVYDGVVYSFGFLRPHWQLHGDGTITPYGSAIVDPATDNPIDPYNMTPAAVENALNAPELPTTESELQAYLQDMQQAGIETGYVYQNPSGFFSYDGQPSYVSGRSLAEAAAYSRLVIRGTVAEVEEDRGIYTSLQAVVKVQAGGILKGTDVAEGTLRVRVRPGDVQAGQEYLFLLSAYEKQPWQWTYAAKRNAVIPIENNRKVRRVYRALGLEMPED